MAGLILALDQLQLQGSVWKGHKLRIAEARPDYKKRVLAETASIQVAEAHTLAASGSQEQVDIDPEVDMDPEGPSEESYRIRAPCRQSWTLPCCGTGNKKCLFMPVKQLSLDDWFFKDLDTHSSSRYLVNSMWQQMVDAQARRPAPDPELFNSTAVLPVPVVRLNICCTILKRRIRACTYSCTSCCTGVWL
jgi:hypothetical protein